VKPIAMIVAVHIGNRGIIWRMRGSGLADMKIKSNTILKKTKQSKPAKDLTGRRFGKWVVVNYAGTKVSLYKGYKYYYRMWLCRCDCGVQKNVYESNLISKRSTKCSRCPRVKIAKWKIKIYKIWYRLNQSGQLCKKWQNYEIFKKDVGDPPSNDVRLQRFNNIIPHAPGNTYWGIFNESPLQQQMSEDLKEQFILGNKILMNIRKAKTRDEEIRCMIAARKAGHIYEMIGIAAGISRQRAHIIIKKHSKK
jgi:hypothetical protein